MAIIVELRIIPLGIGVHVSKFLALAVRELDRKGAKYEVTPMCTVFEDENVYDGENHIEEN